MLPLAMGWRHLLFENYPVEPALMDSHIPDGLTVDTYDGSAWLSVIPFTNVHLRPRGVPQRLGIRLPELNLRTYVTYDDQPGVYFFSLDAHGITSVIGARLLHHLPYYFSSISLDRRAERIEFSSRRRHPGARPAQYEATYRPTGDSFVASTRPLPAFLAERYRLYTETPGGSLGWTSVEHSPWTLHPATVDVETNTLLAANGFAHPEPEPVCFYSPGLDVIASPSERIEPAE